MSLSYQCTTHLKLVNKKKVFDFPQIHFRRARMEFSRNSMIKKTSSSGKPLVCAVVKNKLCCHLRPTFTLRHIIYPSVYVFSHFPKARAQVWS